MRDRGRPLGVEICGTSDTQMTPPLGKVSEEVGLKTNRYVERENCIWEERRRREAADEFKFVGAYIPPEGGRPVRHPDSERDGHVGCYAVVLATTEGERKGRRGRGRQRRPAVHGGPRQPHTYVHKASINPQVLSVSL